MAEFKFTGLTLKVAREKAKLTQKQVATPFDLNPQFVSNWERGTCAPPNNILIDLLGVLKLSRKKLIEAMLQDARVKIEAKVYTETAP